MSLNGSWETYQIGITASSNSSLSATTFTSGNGPTTGVEILYVNPEGQLKEIRWKKGTYDSKYSLGETCFLLGFARYFSRLTISYVFQAGLLTQTIFLEFLDWVGPLISPVSGAFRQQFRESTISRSPAQYSVGPTPRMTNGYHIGTRWWQPHLQTYPGALSLLWVGTESKSGYIMFPEGCSKPFDFLTGLAIGGREFGSIKNGRMEKCANHLRRIDYFNKVSLNKL